MELELKPLELELELKTGIEFLATATTALTLVNQLFPNYSFNQLTEVIIFHVIRDM